MTTLRKIQQGEKSIGDLFDNLSEGEWIYTGVDGVMKSLAQAFNTDFEKVNDLVALKNGLRDIQAIAESDHKEMNDDLRKHCAGVIGIMKGRVGKLEWKEWQLLSYKDKIDKIEHTLSVWDNKDFLELVRELSYTGFDAKIVRMNTMSRGTAKEILYLLTFYIVRGTKTAKATNKMSKDGQVLMAQLITQFGLSDSAKGKDATNLSISRIAAAFPEIVMKLIQKRGFANQYGYKGPLPSCLMFSHAPSIIPHGSPYFKEWCNWNDWFKHTISGKKASEFGRVIVAADPINYVEMIHNSTLFTDEERIEIMKTIP